MATESLSIPDEHLAEPCEVLSVPKKHLAEVCEVIRFGLRHHPKVSHSVRVHLLEWVTETEAYIIGEGDEEDIPFEDDDPSES